MFAVLLLALLPVAAAEEVYALWHPDDLPVGVQVQGELPQGHDLTTLMEGLELWNFQADCGFTLIAEREGGPVTLTLGDPDGVVPAGDLLAIEATASTEVVKVVDGVPMRRLESVHITVSAEISWATPEQVTSDACGDALGLASFGAYVGSRMLLPEVPPDYEQEMIDPGCALDEIPDASRMPPLYSFAPSAGLTCDVTAGELHLAPLTVQCTRDENEGATTTWFFGDGATAEGIEVEHVYRTSGSYELESCVTGPAACDFHFCHSHGPFMVCALPEPAIEPVHQEGLSYRFENQSPDDGIGCITTVEWAIFDAADTLVATLDDWEPEFTFPSGGTYRVLLTVGGPAGEASAETELRVGRAGCATVGAGPVLPILLLLAARRRRRTSAG